MIEQAEGRKSGRHRKKQSGSMSPPAPPGKGRRRKGAGAEPAALG